MPVLPVCAPDPEVLQIEKKHRIVSDCRRSAFSGPLPVFGRIIAGCGILSVFSGFAWDPQTACFVRNPARILFAVLVFEMLAGFRPAAHHAPQNRENLFLLAAPALLLLISLVREILFFGIVSFPAVRTACFVSVLPPAALDFTRFFGSLPGSLVLTGLILWLVYCIGNRRSNALPKAGG